MRTHVCLTKHIRGPGREHVLTQETQTQTFSSLKEALVQTAFYECVRTHTPTARGAVHCTKTQEMFKSFPR